MRQILWGLFKKIVIADNCAAYVDQVWATYDTQSGSTLLLAAILFTFQIYGDFSGYSDIAIGTAKLFGIQLMRNFNVPYFSRDIAEFWRRWHISLTTWFRDYVYIPLGGSRPNIPEAIRLKGDKAIEARYTKWIAVRNTFIIFLLSGFWHGANWTFIVWGIYHALLFVPLLLMGKNRKYTNQVAEGRLLPTWCEVLQMLVTFILVVIGWIIFRAETITQAWDILCGICNNSILSMPWLMTRGFYLPLLLFISTMLFVEWCNKELAHGLARLPKKKTLRYGVYFVLIMLCCFYMYAHIETDSQFIYFQF
jgi:D-alanyl-lipoteichoic acid acyltransferase DltB (MBOAT superfamily)